MNPEIDFNTLISLNIPKQIAFAYLAAKRALPTSVVFCKKYRFGEEKIFGNSVQLLSNAIFNSYRNIEVEDMLEILSNNCPGTDEFPNYDGTVAQDCGGVFFTSMEMLLTSKRNDHLKDLSTLLTDAFDAYVFAKNDLDYNVENFEDIIASDSQMQGEINAQNSIISYLESKSSIDQSDIEYLTIWQQPFIVNLIWD